MDHDGKTKSKGQDRRAKDIETFKMKKNTKTVSKDKIIKKPEPKAKASPKKDKSPDRQNSKLSSVRNETPDISDNGGA